MSEAFGSKSERGLDVRTWLPPLLINVHAELLFPTYSIQLWSLRRIFGNHMVLVHRFLSSCHEGMNSILISRGGGNKQGFQRGMKFSTERRGYAVSRPNKQRTER